jgi:ADP-ribosylglycohydrolase
MKYSKATDALIGMAVGDALGVPVEFLSRKYAQAKNSKHYERLWHAQSTAGHLV